MAASPPDRIRPVRVILIFSFTFSYNVSLGCSAGCCQEVFGRIVRKLLSVLVRLDVALVYFRGFYFQSITATLPVEVPGLNGGRCVAYPKPFLPPPTLWEIQRPRPLRRPL